MPLILEVRCREGSNGVLKVCNVGTTAFEEVFDNDPTVDFSKTEPVLDVQRVVLPPFKVDLINEEAKVVGPPLEDFPKFAGCGAMQS